MACRRCVAAGWMLVAMVAHSGSMTTGHAAGSCPAAYPAFGPHPAVIVGANQIAHSRVNSIDACCDACAARSGCVSFDYNPDAAGSGPTAPNCWLHSDTLCVPATNGRVRISGVLCRTGSPSYPGCKNFTCPPPGPPPPGPPGPHPGPPPPPFPPPCPGCPAVVRVAVAIGPTVVHTVLPEYASVDLDYWHNTTMSGGDWGNASIFTINLNDPRLQNLVAALHPVFIRLGGSMDVDVKYQFGNMSLQECRVPSDFRGTKVSLCLTRQRWDEVLAFYNATAASLVFGTSYHGTNLSNLEALLAYTATAGRVRVAGLELGEEMSPELSSPGFAELVTAYADLRRLARQLWPSSPPKILGPSTGMGQENTHNRFMAGFLNTTLARGLLDGVNMHSYNNDGGWPRPGFLSQTLEQADAMLAMTRWTSATAELWCGECGPHNGGGVQHVTDTLASSFWYVDALGALASRGFAQHGRQALVGSHYGLLAETTHLPNPDYWALLAWKRLMGVGVLSVDVTNLTSTNGKWHAVNRTLHVYAHCARTVTAQRGHKRGPAARSVDVGVGDSCPGGKIAVAFINIGSATTYELAFRAGASDRSELHFAVPGAGDPALSKTVLLNNRTLELGSDNAVPEFGAVAGPASTPLLVRPYTFGFATLTV